jgi:hypothetical protein
MSPTLLPHSSARRLLVVRQNLKLKSTSIKIPQLLLHSYAEAPYVRGQSLSLYFWAKQRNLSEPQKSICHSHPPPSTPLSSILLSSHLQALNLKPIAPPSSYHPSHEPTPPLDDHPIRPTAKQHSSSPHRHTSPHAPPAPPSAKIKFGVEMEAERVSRGPFASSAPNRHPLIKAQSKRTRLENATYKNLTLLEIKPGP